MTHWVREYRKWKRIWGEESCVRASLVAQTVKNLPTMWETWVWSLGRENSLEDGMATHSSILVWKIPMDRGAWRDTVHEVTKSHTWLTKHNHVLDYDGTFMEHLADNEQEAEYLQVKRRVREGNLDYRVTNTSTDDHTYGDRRCAFRWSHPKETYEWLKRKDA